MFGHSLLFVIYIGARMSSTTDTVGKDGTREKADKHDMGAVWKNPDALDALTSDHCLRTEREKLKESVKSEIPKSSEK